MNLRKQSFKFLAELSTFLILGNASEIGLAASESLPAENSSLESSFGPFTYIFQRTADSAETLAKTLPETEKNLQILSKIIEEAENIFQIISNIVADGSQETEYLSEVSDEIENTSEALAATEVTSEILFETDVSTEISLSEPGLTLVWGDEEAQIMTDGVIYAYKDVSDNLSVSSAYLLVPSMETLREDLCGMIKEYEGSWSIYIKDLKCSISLLINDRPQDSASLIKLYIAGAVLENIRDQRLASTDTIDQLLSDMVSLSDNEAANELVRYLSDEHDHRDGLVEVNRFISAHGYSDTYQYNGLEDPDLWYSDEFNVTSVRDCGRLLEEVYNGRFINHLVSRQLEGYLLNQDITWKIPAGIPSHIQTANKTGEKDNTQNDISIVYTPYRDYIICVMATDLTDEDTAVENIRAVSKRVYDFFQQSDNMYMIAEKAEGETEIVFAEE